MSFVEQRGIPPGKIGLQGQSFGAGIALLSAAVIPDVAAVVADIPFSDVRPLLDNEIRLRGLPTIFAPGVSVFARLLYGLDLDAIAPERALAQIAPRPVMFIHGTADDRIPIEHSYHLKAVSNNPADELWIVPGAGHVQAFTIEPDTYALRVTSFFDRSLNR